MPRNPIKQEIRRQLTDDALDPDLMKKGFAKLERWMRAAYGRTDWDNALAEMGMEGLVQTVNSYAAESNSQEYNTFNRQTGNKRRTRHD